MKDKMLKTQRKCHRQNAENPADMSRRGIIEMCFQTQSGHFRWVFSILSVTFPLGFELYVFQSQKPSGNVTAFKIYCVDGTVGRWEVGMSTMDLLFSLIRVMVV